MSQGAEQHLNQEAVLQRVMRLQAALSLRISSIFVLLLIGLPLVNQYLPDLARARVGAFTFSWLFLGVLFFPITWLLSATFIRESNAIEAQLAAEIGRHGPERHEGLHTLEEALEEEEDDLAIPPPRPSRESVSSEESTPRDQGEGNR
jgi:uncharacterized membrane protein (DUF485 family)